MNRKMIYALIIIVGLTAWSPWLTQSFAETRAINSFNKSWATVVDGCRTNCKGCGAIKSKHIPFGMEVTLEYGCGLMPADTAEYHEHAAEFVSPFGTVHGFPRP